MDGVEVPATLNVNGNHGNHEISENFENYDVINDSNNLYLNEEQPKEDNGLGILLYGPSVKGGTRPRLIEYRDGFYKIFKPYEDMLNKALRYAKEQTLNKTNSKEPTKLLCTNSLDLRIKAAAMMCRIYVGSINFEISDDTIRSIFAPFGPLRKIDLSLDGSSMKHKGFSFIDFEVPDSAQIALEQMNGYLVAGRPIKVGRPTNNPQMLPWMEQLVEDSQKYPKLFLSNIHPDISVNDIRSVFEAFGKILYCELVTDVVTKKHRGFGYVEYEDLQASKDALTSMNLFNFGGYLLRVGKAITNKKMIENVKSLPIATTLAAAAVAARLQEIDQKSKIKKSRFSGKPIENNVAPAPIIIPISENDVPRPLPAPNAEEHTHGQKILDDLAKQKYKDATLHSMENICVKGSSARYLITQRLIRQSTVVVLRNMINSENVDDQLEDEINEECSSYGKVKSIIVNQEKQSDFYYAEVLVKVFVEFEKNEEAEKAQQALNGKWFDGNCIKAEFYDLTRYTNGDLSG